MEHEIKNNYLKDELYELIRKDKSVFDVIQESIWEGIWYWDFEKPENRWMSARFWNLLGYKPEERPHDPTAWQSIVNQEDLRIANENFAKHCKDPDHPFDQVVRYSHKDGSTVWVRSRGRVMRDSSGKRIRMLGSSKDISALMLSEQELLKSENKLQESEAKYRDLFKNMNSGFVLFEVVLNDHDNPVDLIIIAANKAFEETTGLKLEDVIGKRLTSVLPEIDQDKADWIGTYSKVALTGEPIRFEDDSELLGNYYSVSAFQAGPKQCAVTFLDITKRKKTEKRLKLLDRAVKASSVSVIITDVNGNISFINPYFTQTTGYSFSEVAGKNPRILNSGNQSKAFYKELWDTIKSGKDWTGEMQNKKKNGELFWEKAVISPIREDVSGITTHFVAIKEDITELLRKEDALKQSLKEKEVMLAEIHHRVKNNLAIISALLELNLFHDQHITAEELIKNSQIRIKAMANVHEMLYESESFSHISFREYVVRLIETIQKTADADWHGPEFNIDIDEVYLNVNQAIPTGLILNELLLNAIKHAFPNNDKGRIGVKLDHVDEMLTLEVNDNGVGMSDPSQVRSSSLGMTLLDVLSNQLEATLEMGNTDEGFKTTLKFELHSNAKGASTNLL